MDDPSAIKQSPTDEDLDSSPDCIFCRIIKHYPPTSPFHSSIEQALDPDKLSPPAYVVLATEDVVAFMDIAPLTRGHVLVAPRKHRVRIGDLKPGEMAEIGRVLPLITKSVVKAVLPDISHNEVDYNVVQNNGPGAAQVIPHVHFHVIPRPPLDYSPPSPNSTTTPTSQSRYGPSKLPTGIQASYIQFGRGMRNELDEDDAAVLVKEIRSNISQEWEKSFGRIDSVSSRSARNQGQSNRRSPEKL